MTKISEDDIRGASQAFGSVGDTSSSTLEKSVVLGDLLRDSSFVHVRGLMKDQDLLYHVFRGPSVPDSFWGKGEFGLVLLEVCELVWPYDKPKVEFLSEVCRPEVYEDNPREPSKFPPHFYGAYLVLIPDVERRLMSQVPSEKAKRMPERLEETLIKKINRWTEN